MGSIIAFDPGFGNTKVCLDSKLSTIQSVVVKPKSIGLAGMGIKSATQMITVSFDGCVFAVGPNAMEWGIPQGNLDYTVLASPERRALLYAALGNLLPTGLTAIDTLIIGLPVPLLQETAQSDIILSALKSYKGLHEFAIGKDTFQLQIDKLKVVAQPLGTYADWMLDCELHPRKYAAAAEVAILDIGMNTFDLYAVRGGRVEPRFVAGAKIGVRRLLEILDVDGRDLEEMDIDLRNGRLKLPPTVVQGWLSELMATIEKTMPKLSRFTAVVPTGGGAIILRDLLQLYLSSRGATLYWPENPVGSNAIGLWKWAAYGANH